MPKIRPKSNDLVVVSKSRKNQRFRSIQRLAYGDLWIDGRKICKTRKDYAYVFHIVDGKIDHWTCAHKSKYMPLIMCKQCKPLVEEVDISKLTSEIFLKEMLSASPEIKAVVPRRAVPKRVTLSKHDA